MFRKIGYIILATLLIITTVGFVISRHYCNDELISVSVDLPADNCCDDTTGNCCHNENETLILKVDFTQPISENINISELSMLETGYIELIGNLAQVVINEKLAFEELHPAGTHPLIVITQSFLL